MNIIPNKIPRNFFYRNRRNNPKICMELQKTQIVKVILNKRTKLEL